MMSQWPLELQQRPWQPTDRPCQDCDGVNVSWWIENRLWMAVMETKKGILCPTCFVRRAQAMGIGRSGSWQLYAPASLE